jgi:hypothetical protein
MKVALALLLISLAGVLDCPSPRQIYPDDVGEGKWTTEPTSSTLIVLPGYGGSDNAKLPAPRGHLP